MTLNSLLTWLNPTHWFNWLAPWHTTINLFLLVLVLASGGGKVVEIVVGVWADFVRPIAQGLGEVMKELITDIWHAFQDAGRKLWAILSDLFSFGAKDTFDNMKTAVFYLGSIAIAVLLTITFLRGTLPPVKAAKCPDVSAEVRSDFWLYEKAKAPHGVIPRPAK